MTTRVVRPSPLMVVVGIVVAAELGNLAATGRAPLVHAVLAGLAVLGFLAVVGHHRVEVGPTVRAVTWWSTGEVLRSRVEAVRRAGQGRPTRLATADDEHPDDEVVAVPPLVGARRVAQALDVPLLTPHGEVVDRRAELRALAWVVGGVVVALVVALLLALAA